MIFVLLGTFPLDFSRPLKEIEDLLEREIINKMVVVQSGHTKFASKKMKMIPFLTLEDLLENYSKADLIISQGGTGSIIRALRLSKKIIAIPRLTKYHEVVDNHQVELVNELAEGGHIIPWHETDNLQDLIKLSEDFEPKPFNLNNERLTNYLIDYIDNL